MRLEVDLYGKNIGSLIRSGTTGISFKSNPEVFPLGSRAMSLALPVTSGRASRGRSSMKSAHFGFFDQLLPEGRIRSNLSRLKHISDKDVYGLLRAVGSDVAGALKIYDPELANQTDAPDTKELDDFGVARMLLETHKEPLGNDASTGRMSLGGIHEKIMLVGSGKEWQRSLNGYPTTHILKPNSSNLELSRIIYNESYGLDIARSAGVLEYQSYIQTFAAGMDALCIERFDRVRSDTGSLSRIHQESASQAMGSNKRYQYQNDDKMNLRSVAKLLRSYAGRRAQIELLRLTVVNIAIGNQDAHAGNIGILHHEDGSIELAPAYDMVPTSHYIMGGGTLPMALWIDGRNMHSDVAQENIIKEAVSWGIREDEAKRVVDEVVEKISFAVTDIQPHPLAHQEAVDNIAQYAKRLKSGKMMGKGKTV